MELNSLPTERAALVGQIAPSSSSAAQTTGAIELKEFKRYMAVVQVGVMQATGTIDAKLRGRVGSGGSPVDIPGKAITQMLAAGGNNRVAIINLDADDLANTGYTHFELSVTGATAASLVNAAVYGFDPRYSPASDNDAAAVVQIVA